MAERPLAVSATDLHFDMASRNTTTDREAVNGSYEHASYSDGASDHGHSMGDQDISWPQERPLQSPDWIPGADQEVTRKAASTASDHFVLYDELLPGHRRSLSGISTRAFFLGVTLGLCIPLAAFSAFRLTPPEPARAWRIHFLLSALSIFHFLEFWTHARFNVPKATVSAFILFNNGWQYTVANALSLLETTVTSIFFPAWQSHFSSAPTLTVAFLVMLMGQACRSTAMAQAGTNFNHRVQTRRSRDHKLVTTGIYSLLRHPSYFGFFWWAVALQVFLGNVFCFWAYLLILWNFFNKRIKRKDQFFCQNHPPTFAISICIASQTEFKQCGTTADLNR